MASVKVGEFVTAVNAAFDSIDAGLDAAQTSATGITDDVAFLKETIQALQDSAGEITPEDQALLDAAQQRVGALSTKVQGLSTALDSIDDATERPAAPPVPPV